MLYSSAVNSALQQCTFNKHTYSTHYTLHTAQCIIHTLLCTLFTIHCTAHTKHFTFHTAYCTLHTAHCPLHTANISNCILHASHCTLQTLQAAYSTLHTAHEKKSLHKLDIAHVRNATESQHDCSDQYSVHITVDSLRCTVFSDQC